MGFSESTRSLQSFNIFENSVSQVGSTHFCSSENGICQITSGEIDSTQGSTSEVSSAQISLTQIGSSQKRISQVSSTQISSTQISSAQIGPAKINVTKVGSAEISFPSSISLQQFFSSHSNNLQNTTTPWTNFLQGPTPFNLNLEITDLPTGQLAEATLTHFDTSGLPTGGTLTLDDDANGLGWFID